jgi:TPP-dependent pyruvate/acetoin dehydrogenase alpha subunit
LDFKERLRAFEKRLQANMRDVYCPTHLCIGQEEVPAALHEHLRPDDWVFSTHRAHGHALAKGVSEQALWDEIMGLPSGINGGFSGSQGFSDEANHFYCSAIVGGLIGVATGTAYALKLNKSDAIVVCCIGDAGVEQGVFWESINFAALHSLPIAYVCENNRMSVDARIEERQAMPIWRRVERFGVSTTFSVREAIDGHAAVALRSAKPGPSSSATTSISPPCCQARSCEQ